MTRRTVAIGAIALATLAAAIAAGAQAALQPQSPAVAASTRTYAAWIPPGTYTAIVVSSTAQNRRWSIRLSTGDASLPVVVPPGDNVVIPFHAGWTVSRDDNARLLSELVPFEDRTGRSEIASDERVFLSAWGITPDGPVPFVYRRE